MALNPSYWTFNLLFLVITLASIAAEHHASAPYKWDNIIWRAAHSVNARCQPPMGDFSGYKNPKKCVFVCTWCIQSVAAATNISTHTHRDTDTGANDSHCASDVLSLPWGESKINSSYVKDVARHLTCPPLVFITGFLPFSLNALHPSLLSPPPPPPLVMCPHALNKAQIV